MNKIYILLLVIVSLLVWRPILDQVPMGEGYYYFDRCQNKFIAPIDCPTTIWQYDNLARLSFQLMIPMLGDNPRLYIIAQFAMMLLLYLILYLVLSKITKNYHFAFITSLLFIANYTGSFSMMAIGNYQRFIQRIPNLIPIFMSFYFLSKYFDTKKYIDIFKSIIIYTIGFYLAHHSIFMLPLFAGFIFMKTISQKINFKNLILNIGVLVTLVAVSLLLSSTDHFVPKVGIISFIIDTPQILEKSLLQIPNLIIPTELVRLIAKNWPIAPIPYPFTYVLKLFATPIFLILLTSLFLVKNNTNIKILFKSAILALPLVCLLNLYSYGDGAPHPLRDFGEDRIYFIPSIYSSIILGYLLSLLIATKKRVLIILLVAMLLSHIIYNTYLINRDAAKLVSNAKKMEVFINYVKNKTINKNIKVALIGPSHLLWPIYFVDHFYNTNDNLVIKLDSSDWKETINTSEFDRIVLLDYVESKIIENKIK